MSTTTRSTRSSRNASSSKRSTRNKKVEEEVKINEQPVDEVFVDETENNVEAEEVQVVEEAPVRSTRVKRQTTTKKTTRKTKKQVEEEKTVVEVVKPKSPPKLATIVEEENLPENNVSVSSKCSFPTFTSVLNCKGMSN